jgi:CHAT domain-containing protein
LTKSSWQKGNSRRFRRNFFAAANRSPRSQVSLAQVRAALRPDELLLEYVLAEPSSFAVAVSRTDSQLLKLPGRSVIETQIQLLARAIQDGRLAADEASTLGTTLISAVSNIGRYPRLIVSADGMTHKVPFELLASRPGTPLLETHVVSYVPSASTLVALRALPQRVTSSTQMALAVGASPEVAADRTAPAGTIGSVTRDLYDIDAQRLRPLPSAGDEARAVVAAFAGRPSTVLVGNGATEEAVKSQPLAGFRLMHFAAHGIVSTKSPERSAIVLRPAAGEDGLLQAREILGLRLNADLVTLSACDTGTGTVHGQEGVASLVRPFIVAGARAVVANLWAADDAFSLSLMREFYRHLASGVDVGESIRQAKLKMRLEFGPVAVPKLWSGILASGDAAIAVAPATTTTQK